MQNYFQPKFYHFSEDSTILAKYAAQIISSENMTVLDLGTGCGIVGIEYFLNTGASGLLIGSDVQSDFQSFFNKNTKQFLSKKVKANFLNLKYSELTKKKFKNEIDLILANPPYFDFGEGRLSKDEQRNICRHYLIDSFSVFIKKVIDLMSEKTLVVIVARLTDRHRELLTKVSKENKLELKINEAEHHQLILLSALNID